MSRAGRCRPFSLWLGRRPGTRTIAAHNCSTGPPLASLDMLYRMWNTFIKEEGEMPIYEYKCEKCEYAFEHLARSARDAAPACPECGAAKPEKLLSGFNAGPSSAFSPPCSDGACPAGPAASGSCATGGCPLQ